jgi:NTE family protein
VLEWLEEHRIPVDFIAGTSIGGLVGGGYATGRSAAEVRALIETIDWDAMFRGEVAYRLKAFRRKEDRREFPVGLEFGVRDGLRLAPGLDPGHEVGLFLSRLALPYTAPLSFDDLPIPFRAVATDLEAAVPVALDRGSLAGALRATMAIPGIFAPIALGDRFLADGVLLNNVPADVARAMGADIVIAVDVGEPLGPREALTSARGGGEPGHRGDDGSADPGRAGPVCGPRHRPGGGAGAVRCLARLRPHPAAGLRRRRCGQ